MEHRMVYINGRYSDVKQRIVAKYGESDKARDMIELKKELNKASNAIKRAVKRFDNVLKLIREHDDNSRML